MKTVLAVVGTTVLSLAASGRSAPELAQDSGLRHEWLPAGTTSVVHLDMVRLRRSTVGSLLLEHREQIGLEELDEVQAELGFDAVQEISSITAYGEGEERKPTTILIHGSAALDGGLEKLREMEGYRSMREGEIDLFFLEETYGYVHVVDRSQRLVVASSSSEAVLRGARVVRGEAPNLAQAKEPALRPSHVEGSFFSVVATELAAVRDFEPASRVFGLAQGIQFDLGEAGGSFFAHLGVATDSVENARKIAQISQGLLALASLVGGDGLPLEVQELLYGIQVNSRGNTVSVDFEYSVEALARILSMVAEESGDQ